MLTLLDGESGLGTEQHSVQLYDMYQNVLARRDVICSGKSYTASILHFIGSSKETARTDVGQSIDTGTMEVDEEIPKNGMYELDDLLADIACALQKETNPKELCLAEFLAKRLKTLTNGMDDVEFYQALANRIIA